MSEEGGNNSSIDIWSPSSLTQQGLVKEKIHGNYQHIHIDESNQQIVEKLQRLEAEYSPDLDAPGRNKMSVVVGVVLDPDGGGNIQYAGKHYFGIGADEVKSLVESGRINDISPGSGILFTFPKGYMAEQIQTVRPVDSLNLQKNLKDVRQVRSLNNEGVFDESLIKEDNDSLGQYHKNRVGAIQSINRNEDDSYTLRVGNYVFDFSEEPVSSDGTPLHSGDRIVIRMEDPDSDIHNEGPDSIKAIHKLGEPIIDRDL